MQAETNPERVFEIATNVFISFEEYLESKEEVFKKPSNSFFN